VFFGKESEKPSVEKSVEELSGEKASEQPQPKRKPKLVQFHCDYCGIDGHKGEFCFKKKHEQRMAKEWAKYQLSNGVLEPRVQMSRAKAIVRMVPAWGDRKVASGAAGRATPARLVHYTSRPVQVWTDKVLVSVLMRRLGFVRVVVVLVVGMGSLQVVSLLGVLPLVLNTGMGGVVALGWRGGTVHGLPFMAFVLLQLERVGSLVVVTVVVFVEVALIGEMFRIVLTPLWSKWLGIGFTLLVLTQC
jgi:hypothetical protein